MSKELLQSKILRELPIDFDWHSAAERAGITEKQLASLKRDEKFMARAEKVMDKLTVELAGADEAVSKFKQTQKILLDELEGGNFSVASNVIKTHEMEFKMHGLFEKDNKQKGEALVMNITMHAPTPKDITAEAIEHVTKL